MGVCEAHLRNAGLLGKPEVIGYFSAPVIDRRDPILGLDTIESLGKASDGRLCAPFHQFGEVNEQDDPLDQRAAKHGTRRPSECVPPGGCVRRIRPAVPRELAADRPGRAAHGASN